MADDEMKDLINDLVQYQRGANEVLERIARSTERFAKNTDMSAYHVPAVVPRPDGSYGVMCYACSREAGQLVAMCQLPPESRDFATDWPIGDLFPNVNDRALHTIEEVRKVASDVLLSTPSGDPRQFVAQRIIEVLTAE